MSGALSAKDRLEEGPEAEEKNDHSVVLKAICSLGQVIHGEKGEVTEGRPT